jgi:hypothetical protein
MERFNCMPLPKTDYHEDSKKLSRSVVEMWLEDLVLENIVAGNQTLTMFGEETFSHFTAFCQRCKLHCDTIISAVKLGIAIKRLNLGGITKGTESRGKLPNVFNINRLKAELKIPDIEDVEVDPEFSAAVNR